MESIAHENLSREFPHCGLKRNPSESPTLTKALLGEACYLSRFFQNQPELVRRGMCQAGGGGVVCGAATFPADFPSRCRQVPAGPRRRGLASSRLSIASPRPNFCLTCSEPDKGTRHVFVSVDRNEKWTPPSKSSVSQCPRCFGPLPLTARSPARLQEGHRRKEQQHAARGKVEHVSHSLLHDLQVASLFYVFGFLYLVPSKTSEENPTPNPA